MALEFNDCKAGVGVLNQPNILIGVIILCPRVHIKRILIELFAKINRNNLLSLEFSALQSYELQLQAELLMTLHPFPIVKAKDVFFVLQRRTMEDLLNCRKRRCLPV